MEGKITRIMAGLDITTSEKYDQFVGWLESLEEKDKVIAIEFLNYVDLTVSMELRKRSAAKLDTLINKYK